MKRLIRLFLLTSVGSAAGCGGASEAGPRWKPAASDRDFRYAPESASNVSTPSKKVLPNQWK